MNAGSQATHQRSRPITKADYDFIVQVIDHWWEGPIAVLAHPIFFYELGSAARVVEDTDSGEVIGFMLGFVAPDEGRGEHIGHKVGYVHLVGIHPQHRRQGVGRALYADFIDTCRRAGCTRLKAITTPGNEGSLRFHEALGWRSVEDRDYAGASRRRIVMTIDLE